jgi:flagellar hook-associated protein 2
MADAIFNGTSRYSNDFQQVIQRTVAIASLPLRQLQSQKTNLSDQSDALTGLQSTFTSLRNALSSIEGSAGLMSYSASAADTAVATPSITTGVLQGTYSLEVVSLGSRSTTLSKDGLTAVANPSTGNLSAETEFTLDANGNQFTFSNISNLSELANAINAKTEANVQATIVNVGSPSTPDYRISIQNKAFGSGTISLQAAGQELLTTVSTGSKTTYRLNGYPAPPASPLESDSNTITIGPGITATLKKVGSTELQVTRSSGSLVNALSSFVDAYNSALDAVDKHRGKSSSVLAGNSTISVVGQSLRKMIAEFDNDGSIDTVEELGMEFTKEGHLQFNAGKITALGEDAVGDIVKFLGTASSGGFLKAASTALSTIDKVGTGAIASAIDGLSAQMKKQDEIIAANEDRIALLEDSLNAQVAAADALIASLEQQVTYMNGLFESLRDQQK